MNLLTKLGKYKAVVAVVFALVFTFAVAAPTFADSPSGTPSGVKPINFGLSYGAATGLGSKDIRSTVSDIINVALGMLGIVAVVIIIIAGFQWMTSGGNEEKAGGARKMIFAGIIGLAIILSAYALSNFVLKQLYKATSTNNADYAETGV